MKKLTIIFHFIKFILLFLVINYGIKYYTSKLCYIFYKVINIDIQLILKLILKLIFKKYSKINLKC
jgi:hypothetical protein